MAAKITFFPVGNGDMTLITLGDNSGTTILIDCNIREAADDPEDQTRDVSKDLRQRIKRDVNGRPYVDVFLQSHPDEDHCRGLRKHFYLGRPEDYPDDWRADSKKRIVIGEVWSSPMVFRRASTTHVLCEDAVAFNTEAKRRVAVNRTKKFSGIAFGDRVLVLGEDENGKTDDLTPILVKVDQVFSRINWSNNATFGARLLAPLPKSDDAEEEEELSKNHSSVILNIAIASDALRTVVRRFLTGGDAEVSIWEQLWDKHVNDPSVFTYDLLLTPHHCSWHSLSHDSWSEFHEDAIVSESARSALSQIRKFGKIVSSSEAILNDDNDPPCYGAKQVYVEIATGVTGSFYCTGEYPTSASVAPLEFSISAEGMNVVAVKSDAAAPSLLRPGVGVGGLSFPNKPVVPNKPAGFA